MNSANTMSLKARIRNIAKSKHIAPQAVLQNYLFERFLERLSRSKYQDNFILKGGLLIAAMTGLESRSTMDMDATVRAFPFDEEHIKTAIEDICTMHDGDAISFHFAGISMIRDDDEYGGFRVSLSAVFEVINAPLSIDITSGDVITPKPVKRAFKTVFDEAGQFELWTYNTETILAEKIETILRRGEYNTRPRDFYDIYLIVKTQTFDRDAFMEALNATAIHRGTSEQIKPAKEILGVIANSIELKKHWEKYRRDYNYAKDIAFEDTVRTIWELMEL
ncbi:MAG: nucleotidyl transferase AbiEii/AbiGii toxin family protein [Treponema sp.]|jgi:predicted nucleotidyltransferase component of viral defense system|nr:nucleotidyl transferase AbiEii/AbiGii toxin family protein [Treponema sp.]